jgi:uncharacterized protein (TIGR02147 family)
MNIYDFDSYHQILTEKISENSLQRGYQAQLAKAGSMHPSYLSRILNHSIHLTPDQAAGICDFWNLNPDETRYFIQLVHLARAGNPKWKKLIEQEIAALRKQNEDLGRSLPAEKITSHDHNVYYSAWYFSAVHVLLTVPEFRTERKIADKLRLPLGAVQSILGVLQNLGLARQHRGTWEPTKNNIHMSNESWMASVHHINWRQKISEHVQLRNENEIHYTGVHSMSATDFKKVQDLLRQTLRKVDEVIRPSKEEDLFILALDSFKI